MQITTIHRQLLFLLASAFIGMAFMGSSKLTSRQSGFPVSSTEIRLKKNARKDGYTISQKNGEYFLIATKVTDPGTQKLLEGIRELSYRCNNSGPETKVPVTFTRGNSQRVSIACAILIEPKIIIEE